MDREKSRQLVLPMCRTAFIHVLLSVSLLNKAYFATFFEGDRLSLGGELAVLLGVLLAGALMTWGSRTNVASRAGGVLISLLLAGHLLAIGLSGWLTPGSWPRGMAPTTLLCFASAIAAAALWAVRPCRSAQP